MKNELKENIRRGQQLIDSVREQESLYDTGEADALWNRIDQSISSRKRNKNFKLFYSVVAATLILGVSVVSFYLIRIPDSSDTTLVNAIEILSARTYEDTQEIVLTLTDNEKIKLEDDANLLYSETGDIYVDSEQLREKPAPAEKSYNEVYVPRGKILRLTLEDSTMLYINSGTKVIYPVPFGKNRRDLYVEGEIYIHVAKDTKRPFIVQTVDFSVEVTGTSFNVSAYGNKKSDVVLVNGSVNVTGKDSHKVQMKPGQQLLLSAGVPDVLQQVDVNDYICWVDRLMKCRSKQLKEVFDKLSLYYDIEFEYDENEIKDITLRGSLDLKDDIEKVLHNISAATEEIIYEIRDKKAIIKKR